MQNPPCPNCCLEILYFSLHTPNDAQTFLLPAIAAMQGDFGYPVYRYIQLQIDPCVNGTLPGMDLTPL